MKVSELAEMAEISTKTVYSHIQRNDLFDINNKYDCSNFILYHLWRQDLAPDNKAEEFLNECGCFMYNKLEKWQIDEFLILLGKKSLSSKSKSESEPNPN